MGFVDGNDKLLISLLTDMLDGDNGALDTLIDLSIERTEQGTWLEHYPKSRYLPYRVRYDPTVYTPPYQWVLTTGSEDNYHGLFLGTSELHVKSKYRLWVLTQFGFTTFNEKWLQWPPLKYKFEEV